MAPFLPNLLISSFIFISALLLCHTVTVAAAPACQTVTAAAVPATVTIQAYCTAGGGAGTPLDAVAIYAKTRKRFDDCEKLGYLVETVETNDPNDFYFTFTLRKYVNVDEKENHEQNVECVDHADAKDSKLEQLFLEMKKELEQLYLEIEKVEQKFDAYIYSKEKMEEIVPKMEEIVPKMEDVVPKLEGVVPKLEGVVPKLEKVVPKIEEVVSNRCSTAAHEEDELNMKMEEKLNILNNGKTWQKQHENEGKKMIRTEVEKDALK
ncbi:hypothetical protein niasHT_008478 [Heterodera trifolii]|uniref:Uncharacterized protein n=1 Tax=Heterodera trifolii TaxID=157864 RepID=A0ABD2M665_9BILA